MLSYTTVIVTFNRKEAIRNALLRQFKQTIPAQKIIVVDNHSTDGTKEYIQDILDKNQDKIKYISLSENLGGSGGFYYGMKAALNENTDLIGISDDDASYDQDYFEKIIKIAESNSLDMAFCGAMYNNGKLDPTTAKYLINENTLRFKSAMVRDYQHGDFYVDNWSFVGPVFRTKMIKEIGLPNKDFFIWFDDSEYSIRMHQKGYRYHVVPNAKINLYTKVISNKTPLWKKYYGFRNEIYSIRKYGKNKKKASIYPYYMLLKKYGAIILREEEYKGRRLKALKYFNKAFSDGMNGKLGKTFDPHYSC